MHAMILAAGRGTRLGRMTAVTPKPMIALGGKPILEHTLGWLRRNGIRDIVINLHHHGERIRSYFGNGSRFGVRLCYSVESELLGTAGALVPVRDRFTSTFLVVYGDNLFDCDVRRLVAWHRDRGAMATMALHERADARQSGVVRLDEGSRIVGFVEKPGAARAFSGLVNAGLLVFEAGMLAAIPGDRPSDLSYDVIPHLLREGRRLYGYVVREPECVFPVDTPEDYARTCALAAARAAR